MKTRTMTVGELRAIIAKLPDNMPVVQSGGHDHSYGLIVHATEGEAERHEEGFSEYHGDQHMSPNGERVEVLILI